MCSERLTRKEEQRLIQKLQQEKLRRRHANMRARDHRIASGRCRIEKTVPSLFRSEIRRLVESILAEIEAGRDPQLRRGDPLLPTHLTMPNIEADTVPNKAPPPGTLGLGPIGRRRAQAARRRERQRAAGLTRTTFDVPVAFSAKISAIVDQAVPLYKEGTQVIVEKALGLAQQFRVDPAIVPDPSPTVVARVLDGLDTRAGDHDEPLICPLFEDVHAVARLKWPVDNDSAGIATALDHVAKPEEA